MYDLGSIGFVVVYVMIGRCLKSFLRLIVLGVMSRWLSRCRCR